MTTSTLSGKDTGGDTKTGRGENRGNIGNTGADILAAASQLDPTGKLSQVLQSFTDGTTIISPTIDKETAFGIVPTGVLITNGFLFQGLNALGEESLIWHGDLDHTAASIGKDTKIAELGISAIVAYYGNVKVRMTRNEAEALMADKMFMSALKSGNRISSSTTETLSVPQSANGLHKHELLKQGFAFAITVAGGRKQVIQRDDITFHTVQTNGYSGEFRVAIMPDYDVVVLGRQNNLNSKLWEFRTIRISALQSVLTSAYIEELIKSWKSWLSENSGKVVTFSGKRRGDVSSIVRRSTTSSTGRQDMAATG